MPPCQKSASYCNSGGEILALLCSDDSKQTLVILPQFLTLDSEDKLEGFVYKFEGFELSEHKSANILPSKCTRMLIFGKGVFFVMLFANILSNPIISQICFCDVTTLGLYCLLSFERFLKGLCHHLMLL